MITNETITDEIFEMFEPVEGFNTVYYGKIGNGKTRNATADILELLNRGEIVFANWSIDFQGFNELEDKRVIFSKFVGGRKQFFKFDKSNFHYLDPQDLIENKTGSNVHLLSRLVGAHLFIDEGQWLFNSLERHDPNDADSVDKLKLVLHGRHYCRSLNVITQRPSNINKNIRSQVHIWYRCVKRFQMFGWIIFERWAIEDMKDDLPVEFITTYNREGKAVKDTPNGQRKTYFVNTRTDKIFPAYNTHAMRSADAIRPVPKFEVYSVDFKDRLRLLLQTHIPFYKKMKEVKTKVGEKIIKLKYKKHVSSEEKVNLS